LKFKKNHEKNEMINLFSNESAPFSNLTFRNCEQLQTFDNITAFFHCYEYFFIKSNYRSIVHWIIILGSIFFNGLVIFLTSNGSNKFSLFDQILFGHCIVDGLTGIVDIPLFHVNDIFGYWPFGKTLGFAWAIYDNNINTTTSLHMAYASYALLRSIKNPKGYARELMFRKPYIIMILIWVFDLVIWSLIAVAFHVNDFTKDIEFKPIFLVSLINVLLWLAPLNLVLFLSILVFDLLRRREIKRKLISTKLKQSNTMNTSLSIITPTSLTPSNNTIISKRINFSQIFNLSAKIKFSLLMGSYWIQWYK
jgi:hypothetical protein